MALRCDFNMDSYIGEEADPLVPNDGTIFIDNVQPNGDITGRHFDAAGTPFDLKSGKCKENPHKISFETDEGFEYKGRIFDVGNQRFVVGTRRRKHKKDEAPGDGDEVWVGVKTAT